MAIASIIHNTVHHTQTLFAHIVKSLVLAPQNRAYVSPIHQSRRTFTPMPLQVPQINHSNLGTAKLTSHQKTIQNHGAKPHTQAGYTVKVFKDTRGHQTGRLALTGRMSDVCAELERMVACEALHQAQQRTLWH